jgi:hypothetical protein
LCRHLLSDPTHGVDVQPKHARYFHPRRQLGIDHLGHHQPPCRAIVVAPLEQRHRRQKDGVAAALRIFEQAQPATEEEPRRRSVYQSRLLIERWPGD